MTEEYLALFRAMMHTTKIVVRTIFTRSGLGQLSQLTGRQFGLMMNIHHKGPLSPSELCDLMFVTPANITGMIARLQKLGFVERRRLTTDRRCLKIALSRLGHEKVAESLPAWHKAISECLCLITADERHQLTALLNKLHGAINATLKNPDHKGAHE